MRGQRQVHVSSLYSITSFFFSYSYFQNGVGDGKAQSLGVFNIFETTFTPNTDKIKKRGRWLGSRPEARGWAEGSSPASLRGDALHSPCGSPAAGGPTGPRKDRLGRHAPPCREHRQGQVL